MATTVLDRSDFVVTERWAYLNHARLAPLPVPARAAADRCALDTARRGVLAHDDHLARMEEVRVAAARVMGVAGSDIAFVKNATEGLGFVANGLAWAEGDRVLVPDLEFPSTLYPWLALRDRGVAVDLVAPRGPGRALPVEAFAEAMAEGRPPRVVATSWVQFGRGWRTDLPSLAALCRAAGSLLCVDAMQGLGVVPASLEEWGVDFAVAGGHKWLLGPEGIGVLYVRADRLDLLRPLEPGWSSVSHRGSGDDLELVWGTGARRLEGGTHNMAGIHALGASLDLLVGAGVEAVWSHVDRLCDLACEGLAGAGATILSDRSRAGRSAIVTFALDGRDPEAVCALLQDRGVVCSPGGGGVRVSPHGYNDEGEIDRLVEAVGAVAG